MREALQFTLLEHQAFLDVDTIVRAPSIQPLFADTQMRAFVVSDISDIKSKRSRVLALVNKLSDNGYYSDYYDAGLTLSARQTFARKRGNCLSYTHMFISLAREAGLDARYELVNAPPEYSVSDGILEHQVHIRTRVMLPRRFESIRTMPDDFDHPTVVTLATPNDRRRFMTVDFNERNLKGFSGRVVPDAFARSLHFANNAVDYWKTGDEAKAFSHIKQAIELAPRYPDHWVNLATFYSRRGMSDKALLINQYVLSLDPRHVIALAGVLQHSHSEEASHAKTRLERLRYNNAFYQFALAQRAVANNDLLGALRFVDRSLTLNRRNHTFLALKSEILVSLERYAQAREVLERASAHAEKEFEQRKYERKLAEIERMIFDRERDTHSSPI